MQPLVETTRSGSPLPICSSFLVISSAPFLLQAFPVHTSKPSRTPPPPLSPLPPFPRALVPPSAIARACCSSFLARFSILSFNFSTFFRFFPLAFPLAFPLPQDDELLLLLLLELLEDLLLRHHLRHFDLQLPNPGHLSVNLLLVAHRRRHLNLARGGGAGARDLNLAELGRRARLLLLQPPLQRLNHLLLLLKQPARLLRSLCRERHGLHLCQERVDGIPRGRAILGLPGLQVGHAPLELGLLGRHLRQARLRGHPPRLQLRHLPRVPAGAGAALPNVLHRTLHFHAPHLGHELLLLLHQLLQGRHAALLLRDDHQELLLARTRGQLDRPDLLLQDVLLHRLQLQLLNLELEPSQLQRGGRGRAFAGLRRLRRGGFGGLGPLLWRELFFLQAERAPNLLRQRRLRRFGGGRFLLHEARHFLLELPRRRGELRLENAHELLLQVLRARRRRLAREPAPATPAGPAAPSAAAPHRPRNQEAKLAAAMSRLRPARGVVPHATQHQLRLPQLEITESKKASRLSPRLHSEQNSRALALRKGKAARDSDARQPSALTKHPRTDTTRHDTRARASKLAS
mmetsp:Transcript_9905/g.25447  ORF Transcript_9905/g.25447 Transcript_9905/m.25447 type:complete len:574 (-) Transcript_9905:31-1752(-)